jgi:hypothetical protein
MGTVFLFVITTWSVTMSPARTVVGPEIEMPTFFVETVLSPETNMSAATVVAQIKNSIENAKRISIGVSEFIHASLLRVLFSGSHPRGACGAG